MSIPLRWNTDQERCEFGNQVTNPKIKANCLYCNAESASSKEHVIPKTLGGKVTLPKSVGICDRCNNGVLSQMDRELCNRSYLSVIASREIDESFWHAWDVDHRDGNVFVEARPNWQDGSLRSFICYPQISFDRNGTHIRGDAQEVLQFGFSDFQSVVFRAAKRLFQEYCYGKKRKIHFEKVPLSLIGSENHFPPRLFFRKSVREIANKGSNSCVLRFCHEEDKRLAFRELDRLDPSHPAKQNWTINPSSSLPRFAIAFDAGDALRGMFKIGLNLLLHTCTSTDFRDQRFARTRQIIYGETQVDRDLIEQNGFVHPKDLRFLNPSPRTHKFRMSYHDGLWTVYSAYFGGDVGSFVQFPGVNEESWQTADIEMKLDTGTLEVNKYAIALPATKQTIEWTDSGSLCPSVELISFASRFEIELTRRRRRSGPETV